MRALRDQAIRVSADDIDLAPATALGRVWGVLVEIGYPEPVATLVALSDGTTSLYFSNGGGVIGAAEHAAVRDAASHLLTVANAHIANFEPTSATPLPTVGRVRFYLRTK